MHFASQAQCKRHVHQSCWEVRALISWEGLHFGASDLEVYWDDSARQVQHFVWSAINFSWQVQHFRQMEWNHRNTHWYEAVSSALNFPFSKEVSQNCFVFDVVNFENWGSLAELSGWIVSFLMLSSSKIEKVSQELFPFWRCQVQKLRKSCRLALFSNLQIDR